MTNHDAAAVEEQSDLERAEALNNENPVQALQAENNMNINNNNEKELEHHSSNGSLPSVDVAQTLLNLSDSTDEHEFIDDPDYSFRRPPVDAGQTEESDATNLALEELLPVTFQQQQQQEVKSPSATPSLLTISVPKSTDLEMESQQQAVEMPRDIPSKSTTTTTTTMVAIPTSKYGEKLEDDDRTSWSTRLFRCLACSIAVVIITLSIVLFKTENNTERGQLVHVNVTAFPTTVSPSIAPPTAFPTSTPSIPTRTTIPTIMPIATNETSFPTEFTPAPSLSISSTFSPTNDTGTLIPTTMPSTTTTISTFSPTKNMTTTPTTLPTQTPTVSPIHHLTVAPTTWTMEFHNEFVVQGSQSRSKLGAVVAMDRQQEIYVAMLEEEEEEEETTNDEMQHVRIYQKISNTTTTSTHWIVHSEYIHKGDIGAIEHVDIAQQQQQQQQQESSSSSILLLAIATSSTFRVMQFVNGQWIPHGQENMQWIDYTTGNGDTTTTTTINTTNTATNTSLTNVIVASPMMALSNNGQILAAASMDTARNNIIARVFQWSGSEWIPMGGIIVRNSTTQDGEDEQQQQQQQQPYLSMSMALAGNGKTIALGDWNSIGGATVDAYEWDESNQQQPSDWIKRRRGESSLTFPWGPSAVALSEDGTILAASTPSPGTAKVYKWVKEVDEQVEAAGEWDQIGGNLVGGTSVALSGDGQRVVIGTSILSTVTIYDLNDDADAWSTTVSFNGAVASQFGACVAMGNDGTTLAVGSPLDDSNGKDAGKVYMYQ